ncbi:hypothetical protein MAR_023521 [Mya arenaria]|uniref:Shieldin complex subunit 2 first OB fold domain-containing protein n=1 Tax=Mya arenaria TaxID=6604 RepID=A0ABY7DST0_MYAAR|nr:hypothetical protein MAR_023521 [Mya arenaria]
MVNGFNHALPLQMTTLTEAVSSRKPLPYDAGVKAKVVARGSILHYTSQGQDKQSLTVALADFSSAVKCIVYDAAKFPRFAVGHTVSLRNIIIRNNTVIITKTSKVFLVPGMDVPEEREREGDHLVHPPPAPELPLDQALRSPAKSKVTVKGQLIQEDSVREVTVNGSPVKLKDLFLKDSTREKVKVTLWRPAPTEAKPGDFVVISDCVVNSYKNEVSLSSTSSTTMKIAEAPLETSQLTVVGAAVEGETTELLLEDGSTRVVPSEMFQTALPAGSFIEEYVVDNAPLVVVVTSKGASTIQVQL